VIVTGHGRAGHLKRALEAGVRGFLPKTVNARVLSDVVRTVHQGGRYVDPELAAEAITPETVRSPRARPTSLSLPLAAPGRRDRSPAHLSPGTVRNHLSAAAAKLGLSNRHSAVDVAARHGWI
jgi:two-component system response regulator DesR